MLEISVLMLKGDWNSGNMAANDKICKNEKSSFFA
jgi:hypothetical protein